MKGKRTGEVGVGGALTQWSECLKERGWTVQSKEMSLTHHPPRIPLNKTFFLMGAHAHTHNSSKVRACAHVHMCLCPCVPPSASLNPCGWGRKGDGRNLLVSVYLLYLSLLSERKRRHVEDAAWGLRVHPSSSSSPHPSISLSVHPPSLSCTS